MVQHFERWLEAMDGKAMVVCMSRWNCTDLYNDLIIIVRDTWLTGFDSFCLHTMYADKPMRGHGLMQARAKKGQVQFTEGDQY